VGPYLYNRGLGATASRRTGDPQGNVNTASAQFDHGLTRSIAIDGSSTVGINLGQGISVLDDSSSGRTEALSHTAGVSWSVAPSENSRAYSALSAADTHRRGATDSDFQLVNLQVSGQYQFSRFALGSANFTTQASRSGGELASTDGYDTRSTGNLSYQHGRAFGVPGLSYSVLYSVNESQFATRQQGDLEAPPHQASQSLEQRLDYRIGLLETRLLARVAETEGLRDWLIFLRVTRRFGTY